MYLTLYLVTYAVTVRFVNFHFSIYFLSGTLFYNYHFFFLLHDFFYSKATVRPQNFKSNFIKVFIPPSLLLLWLTIITILQYFNLKKYRPRPTNAVLLSLKTGPAWMYNEPYISKQEHAYWWIIMFLQGVKKKEIVNRTQLRSAYEH